MYDGINEIIEGIFGLYSKFRLSKERVVTIREFLEEAKIDLKCAKLLYNKKLYSRAIYFLQQSVEKACKSWYFFSSNTPIKRAINEIKHVSPMVFIKQLEGEYSFLFRLTDVIDNLPKDTKKLRKAIKKQSELRVLSDKEILAFMRIVKEYEQLLHEFLPGIFPILIENLSLAVNNETAKIDEKTVKIMCKSTIHLISLYFLSIITFPHVSTTRYPDESLRPGDYTKDLGIVKCFNQLHDETKKSIERFEEYLDLITKKSDQNILLDESLEECP